MTTRKRRRSKGRSTNDRSTKPTKGSKSVADGDQSQAQPGSGLRRLGIAALALLLGIGVVFYASNRRTDSSDDTVSSATTEPVAVELEDVGSLDPRFAEAVREGVARVERAPTDGTAQGHLGRLYHAHKYFDQARRCYESAAQLDPAAANWPYYLAVLALERGDLESAIVRLREALDRKRGYYPALIRLGQALLRTRRAQEARTTFEEAIRLEPQRAPGHLGLGKVELAEGRWQEAVTALERARELDPKSYESGYQLAQAYRRLQRSDDATRLLAEIEPLSKKSTLDDELLDEVWKERRDLQSLIQIANSQLAQGDVGAAEATYQKILSYDEDHFDALFNLGVVRGRQRRFAEARSFLEHAVSADPQNAQAHVVLAQALLSLGDFEAGKTELEEALRLHPGHPKASEILALLESPPSGPEGQ